MKGKKNIDYCGLSPWQYYLLRVKEVPAIKKKARYINSRFFSKRGTVAEIDSGPSLLLIELYKLLKGDLQFYATNIDLRMLKIARERADEENCRIKFIENDPLRLPFKDNSLDLLVSEYSLHRFSEPVKALKEIKRVLKPRGIAFIYGFSPASIYAFIVRFICKVSFLHSIFRNLTDNDLRPLCLSLEASYTAEALQGILEKSGIDKFVVEENIFSKDLRIEIKK